MDELELEPDGHLKLPGWGGGAVHAETYTCTPQTQDPSGIQHMAMDHFQNGH